MFFVVLISCKVIWELHWEKRGQRSVRKYVCGIYTMRTLEVYKFDCLIKCGSHSHFGYV